MDPTYVPGQKPISKRKMKRLGAKKRAKAAKAKKGGKRGRKNRGRHGKARDRGRAMNDNPNLIPLPGQPIPIIPGQPRMQPIPIIPSYLPKPNVKLEPSMSNNSGPKQISNRRKAKYLTRGDKVKRNLGKIKEKIPPPYLPEDGNQIVLDPYNSDLHLNIEEQGLIGFDRHQKGFKYMWGGVRATHGANKGKICFECHILESTPVNMPAKEINPHVLRVGWSVDGSDFQLGEDALSYGYGGTGKKSVDSNFSSYGKPFSDGDTITCCVDLDASPKGMFFMLNGEFLGIAYKMGPELGDKPLFPHVTVKNMKFKMNFGNECPKFPLTPGYTMLQNVHPIDLVRAEMGPSRREDAEIIMMVGLPASGKTTWAENYCKAHPNKRYYMLGTNNIIDKMRLMGLKRKRNYHGRWDVLIDRATDCLNYWFKVAETRVRNYILDQTNVYLTARKRKMENFQGYRRIASIIVNSNEILKERTDHRQKEEGKIVPDGAVMEMKINFTLPEVGANFDKVYYIEQVPPEAIETVASFHAEATAYRGINRERRIEKKQHMLDVKKRKLDSEQKMLNEMKNEVKKTRMNPEQQSWVPTLNVQQQLQLCQIPFIIPTYICSSQFSDIPQAEGTSKVFENRGPDMPQFVDSGPDSSLFVNSGPDWTPFEDSGRDTSPFEDRWQNTSQFQQERGRDKSPFEGRSRDKSPFEDRDRDKSPFEDRDRDKSPFEYSSHDKSPFEGRGRDKPPFEDRSRGKLPFADGVGSKRPSFENRNRDKQSIEDRGRTNPPPKGKGWDKPPFDDRARGKPSFEDRVRSKPPFEERGPTSGRDNQFGRHDSGDSSDARYPYRVGDFRGSSEKYTGRDSQPGRNSQPGRESQQHEAYGGGHSINLDTFWQVPIKQEPRDGYSRNYNQSYPQYQQAFEGHSYSGEVKREPTRYYDDDNTNMNYWL